MKIFVWTDFDLDGSTSLMALRWCLNKDVEYQATTTRKFREDFLSWQLKNKLSDFDKIFILDLDVSDHKDLVDHENVVIFDHHISHVENADYKNCKAYVKEYTSCCKLIYTKFKPEISKERKTLIALADDYDCYALKHPSSSDLNIVHWSMNGNRTKKFIQAFDNGFRGFSLEHTNMIKLHKNKYQKIIDNLEAFVYNTTISGEKVKMVGVLCDYAINEVCDYTVEKFNADVVIAVNLKSKAVSFRKNNETCKVNLEKLAGKIADGGGHEYAAGGKVTDKFMAFLKRFEPL